MRDSKQSEETHVTRAPCDVASPPPLGCKLVWAGPLVSPPLRGRDGCTFTVVRLPTAWCSGLAGHLTSHAGHPFLWKAEWGCSCLPLGLGLGYDQGEHPDLGAQMHSRVPRTDVGACTEDDTLRRARRIPQHTRILLLKHFVCVHTIGSEILGCSLPLEVNVEFCDWQ